MAETVLLEHAQDGTALAVGILASAAAVACWRAHLRGIRADLRSGAVSM